MFQLNQVGSGNTIHSFGRMLSSSTKHFGQNFETNLLTRNPVMQVTATDIDDDVNTHNAAIGYKISQPPRAHAATQQNVHHQQGNRRHQCAHHRAGP